jgi:hypothetical protein
MKRILCVAVTCCLVAFAYGDVIFDNGPADGTNGASCGDFTFGYREAADDFVLDPAWPKYNIDDGEFSYIWYYGGTYTDITVQVSFYEDDGTTKPVMEPFYRTTVPATGVQTGNSYFDRPEMWYSVSFDCVVVDSDTPYWVSFVPMDPPDVNGFWLTSAAGYGNLFRDEGYVDMADAGHPRWTATSVAFGTPYDFSYTLTGYGFPEPGTLGLLAVGAVALLRRR